ncbi:MAG: hypothetical protein IKZ87_06505, partial [Actinomycetaceae bacterium]|nr:hypothetical protein [Actinomycetaceae bacterium]
PVARHSARAPAILRPVVEVAERSCGMMPPYLVLFRPQEYALVALPVTHARTMSIKPPFQLG